jgi:hypothetical protein
LPKHYVPLRVADGGFLPKEFDVAHDLCFVIHDAMAAILSDGEAGGFFKHRIPFTNPEMGAAFQQADNPVAWLQMNGQTQDAAKVLKCVTFPAVLSDMLHCLYEALENSRKAKLNVTYMLLRKPLQESLYVFEEIVLSLEEFAHKLSTQPLSLRAERAGGIDAHTKRITRVLGCLHADVVFAPRRLAELRYDKVLGFDGACNHAIHLFTEHHAIRTELMNINFVFSGPEQKLTQWEYLYLNLPYVLDYMRHVVDHISHGMSMLDRRYQEALNQKIAALFWLWAGWADPVAYDPAMAAHAHRYQEWLEEHCKRLGHDEIDVIDLQTMAHGGFPGEAPMVRRIRSRRQDKPWQRRRP